MSGESECEEGKGNVRGVRRRVMGVCVRVDG